jgi:hypothetical protein
MQHLHLLLILNDSSLDNAAVQSELPTEASYDVPKYFRIVLETCSKVNSLAMFAAHIPALSVIASADSSSPTAARCSWMKLARSL